MQSVQMPAPDNLKNDENRWIIYTIYYNKDRQCFYIFIKDYFITGRGNVIFCAVGFAKFLSKIK